VPERACKAGALPAELHAHVQPHDCNGFLVRMSACFFGRCSRRLICPPIHVQPSRCELLRMTLSTALTLSLGPFGPRTQISGWSVRPCTH
jgi:hypothetical protein